MPNSFHQNIAKKANSKIGCFFLDRGKVTFTADNNVRKYRGSRLYVNCCERPTGWFTWRSCHLAWTCDSSGRSRRYGCSLWSNFQVWHFVLIQLDSGWVIYWEISVYRFYYAFLSYAYHRNFFLNKYLSGLAISLALLPLSSTVPGSCNDFKAVNKVQAF